MRILWLTNIILPSIAEHLSIDKCYGGGWLEGMLNQLVKSDDIKLSVVFPYSKEYRIITGEVGVIKYFGFSEKYDIPTKYNTRLEDVLEEIIKINNPDIIHIFGTEYPHALAMINVARKLSLIDRVVINIQGLCSKIAYHYYLGLPNWIRYVSSLRDVAANNNIFQQRYKFKKRGKFEVEALKNVKYVIGRTDWDYACSKELNPNVKYYYCNEILREKFYNYEWNIEACQKNSIFISQASYPIKGLHFMIQAMSEVIKRFPQTHLYIAGSNITDKSPIRISTYAWYIKKLIRKYKLNSNVTWLGMLDDKQMCERYLKSNVFVSASTIENESNSISEAKIIGVPVVSSFVGGITNRIKHGFDGFLYQQDAPYMLAYYICRIFEDEKTALSLSKNSRKSARVTNDKERNYIELLNIYKKILKLKE